MNLVVNSTPLFTRLLASRGLTDPDQIQNFLYPTLDKLEDPFLMHGMRAAVERIRRAVANQEKILVHGDYDVDGITGAALLARTLTALEAQFSTFLPDRAKDGYGVSEQAIQSAPQNGVSLLITVDCGISARKEIELARSLGLDVLVLDHHRIPPDGLPPASVILNPLQDGCSYPFKELSAAGLAFKLAQALLGPRAFEFLDLAALSTVCDVAPLLQENRLIVKEGLKLLSARKNPGIRALAEVASIKTREMNVGHIGFILGPRLNAAGRMSSAEISLRLLMTDHAREAESLATVLNEENKLRQKEEREVLRQAVREVERTMNFNRERVIVVAKEGWHAGVIGIVASRLVEKFYRPAVVIALDKGKGKGSGRSIKGFHLFYALEACKESLEQFGGHEQAAGLSIEDSKVAEFRKTINAYAQQAVAPEIFIKKARFDLELELGDFTSSFLQELNLLEPHGAANPRPVFLSRNLEVKTKPSRLGKGETYSSLQFFVTDGFRTFEAVCSADQERKEIERGSKADLFYSVKTKTWDGITSLILEVKEIKIIM